MSSSLQWRGTLLVFVLALGCAAFRRGEYWEGDTEAAPGDASGDASSTSGPAPSDTGEPETTGPSTSSGDVPSTAGESSGASGPTFGDVLPLLRAGCDRCHTADGAANATAFLLDVDDDTAYDVTLAFVDLDAPASSRLLAKTAGQGHTGGVIYDDHSAEYETILAWIEHGATR
jgi:hypothetical protein